MPIKQPCLDHLGNEFDSIKNMCIHWGIPSHTFQYRINKGWSLKDALTTPIRETSKVCYDHNNNKFKSMSDMCIHWGIPIRTFCHRINQGWSLEDALTTPVNKHSKTCYDHTNRRFNSVNEMCEYWGIPVHTYYHRIKQGMTLEETLTTPAGFFKKQLAEKKAMEEAKRSKLLESRMVEYNGKEYSSASKLAKELGLNKAAIITYIKSGKNIDDLINKHKNTENSRVDHTGKMFKTVKDMCKHWGIGYSAYLRRIGAGMSKELALTTPLDNSFKGMAIKFNGETYKSIAELASKYDIEPYKLRQRLRGGIDIAVAVTCTEKISLGFIGLDGKARYIVGGFRDKLYTARELVEKYRPDLLEAYDKYNPTGAYEPYNGE